MDILRSIWNVIQYQVLGMRWLNGWMGRLVEALGLDPASRLGGSLQFFLYDVVKILLLLCLLISASPTSKAISRRNAANASWVNFTAWAPIVSPRSWVR